MGREYLQSAPIQRDPATHLFPRFPCHQSSSPSLFKAPTIQPNHQQLPKNQCREVLWPCLPPDIGTVKYLAWISAHREDFPLPVSSPLHSVTPEWLSGAVMLQSVHLHVVPAHHMDPSVIQAWVLLPQFIRNNSLEATGMEWGRRQSSKKNRCCRTLSHLLMWCTWT